MSTPTSFIEDTPTSFTPDTSGVSLPAPTITPNVPFPATGQEGPVAAGLKAVGNLPASAFGFAKGLVTAVAHPIKTVEGIGAVAAGGASELGRKLGTGANVGKPQTSEEQTFNNFVDLLKQRYGSLDNARQTAINDPFGVGSDIAALISGGATLAGKGAEVGNLASKAASIATKPVVAPAEFAAPIAANVAKGAAKFSIGQAMGLDQSTIGEILTNPANFSKAAEASVNRGAIAADVKTSLEARQANLAETGSHYSPVREANTPVTVQPDFLQRALKENAGVDVVNGQVTAGTLSKARSPSDVRALQSLYDFWGPQFETGTLTSPEFLNFRSDLASLAKFDRQIGKSAPLETIAGGIRKTLNENYRGQIPDLQSLDAEFAAQQSDFERLSKGIIDNNGNLTDSAINRIANATGKGKDLLVQRLEEASPGITQRIKTLKAVEDIQSTRGQIPGRYGRAGLIGLAAYTFNPYLIVATVLSLPELGIPILRGIGMATPKIKSTLELLGVPTAAKALHNAGTEVAPALPTAQASAPTPGI